jgi:hypothetical protein
MRTALLLSGHTRTLDECLPSLVRELIAPLAARGPVECYVSTVADADAKKTELLRGVKELARVEIETVPAQPDCIAELRAAGCTLPATWSRGTAYLGERYPISVHPQAVARQLWHLARVYQFFLSANPVAATPPDLYVRLRPDLEIEAITLPLLPLAPAAAATPWWGRFAGVNDRLAFLGATAAASYFGTYARLPALLKAGHPLHPETLLRTALEQAGCAIDDRLPAIFSTRRPGGQLRAPEITWADVQHLAASLPPSSLAPRPSP